MVENMRRKISDEEHGLNRNRKGFYLNQQK